VEIMKIGVALSGCHPGGASAYRVLCGLEEKGFDIEMVSCCCTPAVTALLHGSGEEERADKIMRTFAEKTRLENLDSAIAAAAALLPASLLTKNRKTAVNAVHVADGTVVTFTNGFSLASQKIHTLPLEDAYAILSATVSPLDGQGCYRQGDLCLCDYAVWYGSPLYPLRMNGISRIVSIAFLPQIPQKPYEVLVKQHIESSARAAEIHIPIEFPAEISSPDEMTDYAAAQVESCLNDIAWQMLYPGEGERKIFAIEKCRKI
jgi:hypothetical protein